MLWPWSTRRSAPQMTMPLQAWHGPANSLLLSLPLMGAEPSCDRLFQGFAPLLEAYRAKDAFMLVPRVRQESWRGRPAPSGTVQEIAHWQCDAPSNAFSGVVLAGKGLPLSEIERAFHYDPGTFLEWAARKGGCAVVHSTEPQILEPHVEPKVWGREIWFTGMEKRGCSSVRSPTGNTALPLALSLFPQAMLGGAFAPPLLVKLLEPLPLPGQGDLYLEMHREKEEVYVVQQVNREAWPQDEGILFAGLTHRAAGLTHRAAGLTHQAAGLTHQAAGLTQRAEDQAALGGITQLAEAIGTYETVRREIDQRLVEQTAQENPVQLSVDARMEALQALPQDLRDREAELRTRVHGHLQRVPVRAGDVVFLKSHRLHSLQHGIRVVEFQTPTWERLIAMATQQVVTQSGWDTAEALLLIDRTPYIPPIVEPLEESEGIRLERLVYGKDFELRRLELKFNHQHDEPATSLYRILFVTEGAGELVLSGKRGFPLKPEQALLLPAAVGDYTVHALAAQGLTLLIADPHRSAESLRESPESSATGVLHDLSLQNVDHYW